MMTSGYFSATRLSAALTPGKGPHVGISAYTASASLSRYSRPNRRMVRSSEWATIWWNGW